MTSTESMRRSSEDVRHPAPGAADPGLEGSDDAAIDPADLSGVLSELNGDL